MRRVRRVVHRNPTNPHLLTLQLGHHLVQRTRITGDHDRARAVDRSDRYRAIPAGDALPCLVHRQPHRHHPATARQTTRDGPRPQRHHLRRVLQRQRTGHTRRRDLTLTVTHHRVRHHTHRTPQPRQRHHHREQHRLHDIHPVITGSTLGTTQHIRQRPVHIRRQRRLTLGHRLREHRRGVQQPHRHTHPLRPLTREHEHRTTGRRALAHHHARASGLLRDGAQAGQQRVPVPAHQHRAVLQHRPSQDQRPRHIGGVQFRTLGHELPQSLRLRPQPLLATARHHPGHRAIGDLCLRVASRLSLRRLLQNHVRVRPAHTERGHTGPAPLARLRPRGRLGQQRHRPRRPVHVFRRLAHVQRLGQHAVPHRHHHLDDATHARGCLGVPHVRLERAQPQRPVGSGALLAVRGQQRLRLDRVTQRCSGAVCLHRVHIGRGQAGVAQRVADHPLLGGAVGRRQSAARAVLVHGGAPYHGQHLVPVALGVGQPLQQQHAGALGPSGAVGGVRERLAASVRGEAAQPAELDEHPWCRHHGHATGERERAVALAERLDGQLERHQRRGARGVHGHGGAFEAEGVRDAAGGDTSGAAVAEVAFEALRYGLDAGAVVVVHHADEHAGSAAARGRRVDARPLQRFPRGLKEQPLLRVGRQRLTRAHTEEGGVEAVRVVQEPALTRVALARLLRVGVVQVLVPPPVHGEGGDRVGARGDQLPKIFGRLHPSGIPAPHADDRDGLPVPVLEFLQLLTSFVQAGRRALEVVAQLGLAHRFWSLL